MHGTAATNEWREATAGWESLAAANPRHLDALLWLGYARAADGQPEQAAEYFRRALEVCPDHPVAAINLAALYVELLQLDAARSQLDRLVQMHPNIPEAHNHLACAHLACGRVDPAIRCYRRALDLNPQYVQAHSNLLHALIYSDACRPEEAFNEHLNWARMHAAGPSNPARTSPDPDRPIRIGYLSPDLRNHPVAYFLEPILARHDSRRYEVICYQDSPVNDAVTSRLRELASAWRETAGHSDDQLEQLIRQDRIDVLVDLAVHSGQNRLAMLARKPAPIIISYLGYAFTTGLSAVDYRITDHIVDPPGMTEALHTERLLRLPDVFWCYRPPVPSPDITPLPALSAGWITFGSANRLAKITPSVARCWAAVLDRVSGSRLHLIAPELRGSSARSYATELFAAAGIKTDRLVLQGAMPLEDYLSAVSGFDIALDTFPFTGGATTCHTLWMGVPVVTLAGSSPIARVSTSILSAIRRRDLVADHPLQFIEIATSLASDLRLLVKLREDMRARIIQSPFMNEPRFVSSLEAAYRRTWQEWCATQTGNPTHGR